MGSTPASRPTSRNLNQIATALGVSRATLYRHLALADEAEQAA